MRITMGGRFGEAFETARGGCLRERRRINATPGGPPMPSVARTRILKRTPAAPRFGQSIKTFAKYGSCDWLKTFLPGPGHYRKTFHCFGVATKGNLSPQNLGSHKLHCISTIEF
jgi:hypothetical protein